MYKGESVESDLQKSDKDLLWLPLLHDLQKRYRLKELRFDFGSRTVEMVKVDDINELLDEVVDVDAIPFWAELWPAAVGLASEILKNQDLITGKELLELGSGVGLAGIAAKIAGSRVTQSDFIEEAFKFIRVNCLRNNLEVEPLLLADWRNFPAGAGPFDYIIGADILYEKDLHGDLLKVFKEILRPGGQVWLADPGRNHGKLFMEKAVLMGWERKQEQIKVFHEQQHYHIDIYHLSYRGNN